MHAFACSPPQRLAGEESGLRPHQEQQRRGERGAPAQRRRQLERPDEQHAREAESRAVPHLEAPKTEGVRDDDQQRPHAEHEHRRARESARAPRRERTRPERQRSERQLDRGHAGVTKVRRVVGAE
jgi:hypothetical protein